MNTKIMTARCQKFLPSRLKSILPTWLICAVVLGCWVAPATHAADGTPVWTNIFNSVGNDNDWARCLALDGSGNVYVKGYSAGYVTIKYSNAGVPVWTNHFTGGGAGTSGNPGDPAQSLAVDGSGNAYVTGYVLGSGNNNDYVTIKYSSAGTPIWTNLFNGALNSTDQAQSVAVDGDGNVYVTGFSFGSGNSDDYATIKYSGAGVPVWTNLFNGPINNSDQAQSVAVDGSGNVYVTGSSAYANAYYDYVTIKYSTAGVPVWTNRFNGAGNEYDQAQCLALDTNGNVFVTGYTTSGGLDRDYATIKYSSAGVPVWTNIFNGVGNGNDQAQSLVVDGNGNVYVTGHSYGGVSGDDYATIKYSSAGVPVWTNIFNGTSNRTDYAYSLAVDTNGNVFVTGYANGGGNGQDCATIKYSSAGVPVWTNLFNGAGNGGDMGQSLAVDGSGNVFVTGYSAGSGTGADYATIKYSGPPPTVTGSQIIGNGMVATLTGLTPGQKVISEASSSLTGWTPVQTNTATGSSLSITNPYSTSMAAQFYRISVQ